MRTIAVVGANGQVGSEVCLYLSVMPNVRVVPICRTQLGSAFLRRCGLECRHGSVSVPEEAARLLEGCDAVADFSLPKGRASEICAASQTILQNLAQQAPRGARLIYISSLMAFGSGPRHRVYRHYPLSHTVYGATKRYAERASLRVGREAGRETYVFRLGQVHGVLQAITRMRLRGFRDELTWVLPGASDTVFVSSIAEALVNAAEGKERPGSYSLVSVPQWTHREMHEYFARELGYEPKVAELSPRSANAGIGGLVSSLRQRALGQAMHLVNENREMLAAYLLSSSPELELKAKATSLRKATAAQIAEGENAKRYQPYDPILGEVPGERLRSLSDSRITMPPLAAQVRKLVANVTSGGAGVL